MRLQVIDHLFTCQKVLRSIRTKLFVIDLLLLLITKSNNNFSPLRDTLNHIHQ